MSEKENNSEGQKPQLNRLALRSFLVPGLNWVIVLVGAMLAWLLEGVDPNQGGVLEVAVVIFICIASVGVFALILTPAYGIRRGRKGLRQIKKNPERFVGRRWAIAGIVLSLLTWGILVGVPVSQGISGRVQYNRRAICGQNLWNLGTALRVYAGDYAKYPTPDKWCDLLMQKAGANEEWFRCPGDRKGPCSYALNRNAEPNSPGEMVLLFEAKPGWNHYGGPEILSKRNHKWEGCMVLFNDGHVKFEKARDPNNFLWQDIKDRAEDERGTE